MLGDQISGTGDPTGSNALKSDLKFVELVADIFGSLRQVRDLQGRQAHLSGFLSRPVLAALAEHDMDEVLMPRQTEVTVLFCDLRGSCRIAEEGQDELFGLWNRVGEALGVMTGSITAQDGVIGDFQGDAAMGFWGWPLTCDDQVERAAQAALEIWRTFMNKAKQAKHPLAGFNCGIGIANGQAIAGQLGTPDQFKVGVYGPIVNLASRLESLTKFFRVPILLNESAGRRLAACQIGPWARLRQLARIQPYGMRTTLMVSELMPPAFEPGTLSERDRRDYEAALEAFLSSHWDDARGCSIVCPATAPANESGRSWIAISRSRPPNGMASSPWIRSDAIRTEEISPLETLIAPERRRPLIPTRRSEMPSWFLPSCRPLSEAIRKVSHGITKGYVTQATADSLVRPGNSRGPPQLARPGTQCNSLISKEFLSG